MKDSKSFDYSQKMGWGGKVTLLFVKLFFSFTILVLLFLYTSDNAKAENCPTLDPADGWICDDNTRGWTYFDCTPLIPNDAMCGISFNYCYRPIPNTTPQAFEIYITRWDISNSNCDCIDIKQEIIFAIFSSPLFNNSIYPKIAFDIYTVPCWQPVLDNDVWTYLPCQQEACCKNKYLVTYKLMHHHPYPPYSVVDDVEYIPEPPVNIICLPEFIPVEFCIGECGDWTFLDFSDPISRQGTPSEPTTEIYQSSKVRLIESIIFPNPSLGKVTIQFSEKFNEKAKLIFTNVFGVEVLLVQNITSNKIELDFSGIAPGVYFYNINVGEKTVDTGKIIIQK